MSVRKLSKDEFLSRAADLWLKFRDRLQGVSYEQYIKEATDEWEKQNNMTLEQLEKYRNSTFNDSVAETKKISTSEEIKKYEEADLNTAIPGEN